MATLYCHIASYARHGRHGKALGYAAVVQHLDGALEHQEEYVEGSMDLSDAEVYAASLALRFCSSWIRLLYWRGEVDRLVIRSISPYLLQRNLTILRDEMNRDIADLSKTGVGVSFESVAGNWHVQHVAESAARLAADLGAARIIFKKEAERGPEKE